MDRADAARLASYLCNAAYATRATPEHWRRWADRLIEQDELDLWILDVSVAKTFDQLHAAMNSVSPMCPDAHAVIGHRWRLHQAGELSFREFLKSTTHGALVGAAKEGLEYLLWELEDDDSPGAETAIACRTAELVAKRRLAELADEQWNALFR